MGGNVGLCPQSEMEWRAYVHRAGQNVVLVGYNVGLGFIEWEGM